MAIIAEKGCLKLIELTTNFNLKLIHDPVVQLKIQCIYHIVFHEWYWCLTNDWQARKGRKGLWTSGFAHKSWWCCGIPNTQSRLSSAQRPIRKSSNKILFNPCNCASKDRGSACFEVEAKDFENWKIWCGIQSHTETWCFVWKD
jgi:hypothetical protein